MQIKCKLNVFVAMSSAVVVENYWGTMTSLFDS